MTPAQSKARVEEGLRNRGYTLKFGASRFLNMNASGKEVHQISYVNEDTGLPERGLVYVWTEGATVLADF